MLLLLVGLPLALVWQVYVARQSTRLLNIHQIEEYQNARFWRWVWSAHTRQMNDRFALACIGLLLLWPLALLSIPQLWVFLVLAVLSAALPVMQALRIEAVQAKKPLVYTARAKRLLGTEIVLLALFALALATILWFAFQLPTGFQLSWMTFAWGTTLLLGLGILSQGA